MCKGLVRTAGGAAHQLLTREDTPERELELYLPDDEDVKAIGEPLAGLASRRVPEGVANPDVTDLLGLVAGVVGYLFKQQAKKAAALRRRLVEEQLHPEGDEPAPVDV